MSAQRACTFVDPRSARQLSYLLFLPADYAARAWPLIVFLHGAGERGTDPELLKREAIPRLVESQPDFPFVVVAPQCPPGSHWRPQLAAVEALIDEILATHTIDPARVYLTGISMGGYGTWTLAARRPDLFAAAVPICGGGLETPAQIQRLRALPIWAFHGALDPIVPLHASARMVEALRAAGGDVKLTIYPDLEHDCWTRTYADPALYEWLLSHWRSTPHS